MRIRLFWKILFSFWLTFICIIEGVWIIFTMYEAPRVNPRMERAVETLASAKLETATMAVQLAGVPRLEELITSWPESEQGRLTFLRLPKAVHDGMPPPPARFPVYFRTVPLPGGDVLQLRFDATRALFERKKPGPFDIPMELVALGVAGGLLFSALLAWYLTAPLWKLRAGFDELASGNLDIRLNPIMGRRRDEITDLARDFDMMAGRMQALLESREQLLHDVSHELRSPLARLHMAVGLARQNQAQRDPEGIQPLLDRIERESVRMDELVGELLTLSRVESGGEVADEYFDLQELTRVVVDTVRFEAVEDGVDIALDAAPADTVAMVRGDAELVRRALENVIRNGLRHSPRGSAVRVTVSIGAGRDTCRIQVADAGPGVPEASLTRIFDPFVRLKNIPGNSPGKGAGLGLAIARRAIAVHGGAIRAANGASGGLLITIDLPLAPFNMSDGDDS